MDHVNYYVINYNYARKWKKYAHCTFHNIYTFVKPFYIAKGFIADSISAFGRVLSRLPLNSGKYLAQLRICGHVSDFVWLC